ncbi:primary amine oxidase, partial [Genlisea aurea]
MDVLLRYTLFFCLLLFLIFTISTITSPPSDSPELLDCTSEFLRSPTVNNRRRPSDAARHPLDPLTVSEHKKLQSIIRSHELFRDAAYALHFVALDDPPKEAVLQWRKGDPISPRKAAVVARVAGASYSLTVDLESGDVAF